MSTFPVVNPATGRTVATLRAQGPRAVARLYAAARAAQGAWAARPLRARVAALARFRGRLIREAEPLAQLLTSEVGKPVAQARNELRAVVGRIDFFLEHAGRVLAPETVLDDGKAGMTEQITHEPLGVVANISAWNYPYFVGGNVFIPALLAGNAVLYKPSEFASLTGLALARLLHQSGVPEAVFAPVIGRGETGAALVAAPVDGIFFTGSHATGKAIAQAAAGRMIRLQLELGGKDPVYVCDDADPEQAAAIADGAFYNTGQSCCSVERIYVHRRKYRAFVAAFVAEVQRYRLGDPRDEGTYIGPLARPAQRDVLRRQVADARRKGARVLTGGQARPGPGNFFEPTVLVDVTHRMAVMRDESFGPIIGIMAVDSDAEAVALMNDTKFGLTAGVYTRSERRARRILDRVASGSAYWNCCDRVSPRLPWSGVGDSGIGVTLSTYGIQAFTRPKAWHLRQPGR